MFGHFTDDLLGESTRLCGSPNKHVWLDLSDNAQKVIVELGLPVSHPKR